VADGVVSLVEHYLYADLINGFKPDPTAIWRVLHVAGASTLPCRSSRSSSAESLPSS